MDRLKYLLWVEPTRWGELVLGLIKLFLGLTLLWYLWDPPKTSASLTVEQAALIGGAITALALTQIVAVFAESRWPRFFVCCIATGMWIYFMGSQWIAVGSMRPILIYIPILAFNVIVAGRIMQRRSIK